MVKQGVKSGVKDDIETAMDSSTFLGSMTDNSGCSVSSRCFC